MDNKAGTVEIKTLPNGKRVIYVDGSPFQTYGAQIRVDRWRNNGGYTNSQISDLGIFEWAKKLNCNVVQVVIPWKDCEPEPGIYDWTNLDWAVNECNKYNLRMEIIWFGSNVCGSGWANFTPAYIAQSNLVYTRIIKEDGSFLGENDVHGADGTKYSLCVENTCLQIAEKNVVTQMMSHLEYYDRNNTVIGFQVENEPTLVQHNPRFNETDRCYCHICNGLYTKGGYLSGIEFSKDRLALYLDRVASWAKNSKKRVYTRCNWINLFREIDESVSHIMELAPHVDFVGYDNYGQSQDVCYRYLAEKKDGYSNSRNIPHVSEQEGSSPDCRQKIIDVLASNGCGSEIYQLAGWSEQEDNYLLNNAGEDCMEHTAEVRGTFGMLRKVMADIAVCKNGNDNEIQYYNCMGRTEQEYEGTKSLYGIGIKYMTTDCGIGIAIKIDSENIKVMSAGKGSFIIRDQVYEIGSYEIRNVTIK